MTHRALRSSLLTSRFARARPLASASSSELPLARGVLSVRGVAAEGSGVRRAVAALAPVRLRAYRRRAFDAHTACRTPAAMPPRRSSRLLTAVEGDPHNRTVLPLALPHALGARIWAALPCDARLRCRQVCRGWRHALAEPRLWTEIDLTATSGVVARVTPALLLAATARAGGRLERLSLTYAAELHAVPLAVLASNADTLRLLRLECPQHAGYVSYNVCTELLRAAPRQCVVEADVSVLDEHAGRMLRNEEPFQALRLRRLQLFTRLVAPDPIAAWAAELAAHASLRELSLWSARNADLDAVVDAALTLRLRKLELMGCNVRPAHAVSLSRLLRCGALCELTVRNAAFAMLDAGAAALLADALRSNRTLTSLSLRSVRLWHDVDAARALFDALVGHASLTSIDLSQNGDLDAEGAVGTLLGALVAANSPLRVLDISNHQYTDDQLPGPLVDALQRNTHLYELRCSANTWNDAFVRDQLMPALAANTSLWVLHSGCAEADEFIAERTAAMAAAAVEGMQHGRSP